MKGEASAAGLLAALVVAGPAQAFDCAKAATPTQKAICAAPAARAADEAMAKAFAVAIANLSASDRTTALAAQIEWIGERDRSCEPGAKPKLAACLAGQSAIRRAYLAAEPEAGPGAPGRLAPLFRVEKGDDAKARINLQVLRYPAPATPAERAFNAAVERAVGPLDQPTGDVAGDNPWEYVRSMRLAYASPRLVSAHLAAYNSTGGAHPSAYSTDINILVDEGREAKLADLLDARSQQKMFDFCLKSLRMQKKARLGEDLPFEYNLPEAVAGATQKLDAWSFGPNSATISYDAYAVGTYAEGPYDCVIPYSLLKPLARPDFPLP